MATARDEPVDRAIWDWYAASCPCGAPVGECRVHPRARATQRPPLGDWRVWAYIAGRGAGKTRAGAAWIQRRVEDGTSRRTAAVFFQVRPIAGSDRPRVTVFADYHALDVVSQANARAIKALAEQLPCRGRIDVVRLDPAATACSSLGPAAYGEYERVFGSRIIGRWPQHLVLDGLDAMELLLDSGNLTIHPRCGRRLDAFRNYCRQRRRGQWVDFPADGHPEEDLIDALRGGIRDAMPEGSVAASSLRRVHASRLIH
jgi:hypothetical protein